MDVIFNGCVDTDVFNYNWTSWPSNLYTTSICIVVRGTYNSPHGLKVVSERLDDWGESRLEVSNVNEVHKIYWIRKLALRQQAIFTEAGSIQFCMITLMLMTIVSACSWTLMTCTVDETAGSLSQKIISVFGSLWEGRKIPVHLARATIQSRQGAAKARSNFGLWDQHR